MLSWLAQRDLSFAVPVAVVARDGHTLVDHDDYRYALYQLLPGRQPDQHDPLQVHAFGAALGELHHALADYPDERRPGMWGSGELELVHPLLPDPYGLTPEAIGLAGEPGIDELCDWWRNELAALRIFVDGSIYSAAAAGDPRRLLPQVTRCSRASA